jgi:hypothetical protein
MDPDPESDSTTSAEGSSAEAVEEQDDEGRMEVQRDAQENGVEAGMENEAGPSHEGKRVKVRSVA